jgi:hypothetical protein
MGVTKPLANQMADRVNLSSLYSIAILCQASGFAIPASVMAPLAVCSGAMIVVHLQVECAETCGYIVAMAESVVLRPCPFNWMWYPHFYPGKLFALHV